jgi:hypothetical protein
MNEYGEELTYSNIFPNIIATLATPRYNITEHAFSQFQTKGPDYTITFIFQIHACLFIYIITLLFL